MYIKKFLIFLLLLNCSVIWGMDKKIILQKVFNNFSKIRTIKAQISQIVIEKNIKKQYKGLYQASNNGNFRVDYYSPERHILICSSNKIEWYFPKENILYLLSRLQVKSMDTYKRLKSISNLSSRKNIIIQYLGVHLIGLFQSAYLFKIINNRSKSKTLIWVHTKKYVILKRIVKNYKGYEIIKESYGSYKKINKIYVPSIINILARTKEGIIQNITYYKRISLNIHIHYSVYNKTYPNNVQVRKLK